MNIPGPDTLQRDEQARYLKKRGVDPSQFAPNGKDPDAGIDKLDRSDVIEHLPDDVDIGEVESALPDGVHTIDELTQDDLEGMADEYRKIIEEAKPEPTPKELTWWRKAWWMLSGTFYTLVVAALDLEQVHTGRVAHSLWFVRHDTKGSVSINWAVSQVNPGGTVFLPAQGPDTNNRWELDQWIDIDRDNVTLEGEGWNRTLLYVEDGANVGGIRVGVNNGTTRRDITISGVGFNGNADNQDSSVKRLHGLLVEHAERFLIEECFFTRTSPYHEHNDGGSGVSIRHYASDGAVRECWFDDIGDRGVQFAGDNITVRGIISANGYDRAVAMNVAEPDGVQYMARGATVMGCVGRDHSTGSIIGVGSTAEFGNDPRDDLGHYTISGNVAIGNHRRLVTIRGGVSHVSVTCNVDLKNGDEPQPAYDITASGTHYHLSLNLSKNATKIAFRLDCQDYTCIANVADGPGERGISTSGFEGVVALCVVTEAGTQGIYSGSGATTVRGCYVRESGDENYFMDSVAERSKLEGNVSEAADGNGNGANEFQISDSELLVIGNHVSGRSNTCFAESSGADKNLYVANRGDNAIANMWTIQGSHSWGFANYPALSDDEGSVTLTGGVGTGSEAARINGVSSTQGMNLNARVQPDLSGTQPAADFSTDEYLEWDDSVGAWDLVIEWRTDPGSDVNALYEVTREPTSRAVKNA